jgi:hypothetical protein
MPWQRHVVDVAFEVDPATGGLWYEEVVITVPRQSGKTTLILAILVWRCIVASMAWGEQTVIYLAQTRMMARAKLEREFAKLLRRTRSLREVSAAERRHPVRDNEWKLSMNNGSEHVRFGTDSYLLIGAPTETASHGEVLDVAVLDEAFAHRDDLVEQATDAATVTRQSPQSFVVSTAGNAKSVFLWGKVLAGRNACETGSHGRTCYIEYSVPDDCPDDMDEWAKWLPALGHTISRDRLRSRFDKACRETSTTVDEEGFEPGRPGFDRGYLNRWREWPTLAGGSGVSPLPNWLHLASPGDVLTGERVALSVAPDSGSASLAVAGYRPDGLLGVRVERFEPGTRWCVLACQKAAADTGQPITVDPKTATAGLLEGLRSAGVPLHELSLGEVGEACVALHREVADGLIRHGGQPLVDAVVATAVQQRAGRLWRWDPWKSPGDICLLESVTNAAAAVREHRAAPAPFYAY